MHLMSDSTVIWTQLYAPGTFSSSPQLCQPVVILSRCCLSRAIPVYSMPYLFSSIFFMDMCLDSLRRLNFLMEGTLPVHFLYPPDNNCRCREAQNLGRLCDLLKGISNQQWSRFKHKYAKSTNYLSNVVPYKRHIHSCTCSHDSVPTNAIFYPRKERCLVCRSEEAIDNPTIKKLTDLWPEVRVWIFLTGERTMWVNHKKLQRLLWGEQNFCPFPGGSLAKILRGTRSCPPKTLGSFWKPSVYGALASLPY